MTQSLLVLLIALSAVIGFGLGQNHTHVVAFAVGVLCAFVALQVSYIAGWMLAPSEGCRNVACWSRLRRCRDAGL